MANNSLADRMKGYENVSRIYLTKRLPVIVRIDGRAFHGFTKGFERPFDRILMDTMVATTQYLCANITGCKLAYTQSDEISLLLVDYDANDTEPWFDNNLQKLVSISASMATLAFNRAFCENCELFVRDCDERRPDDRPTAYLAALAKAKKTGATFDSRAFTIPKEEVCNYFIWRQQDATRNSILMVAQSLYAHKEIQGIKCDKLQDMLFTEKNVNWNDLPPCQKRGTCVVRQPIEVNGVVRNKWLPDRNTPVFTKDKDYINKLI